MDRKIELQVISISNSQAQVGAFALVLGEVDGNRQLPIIVGPTEAQATSLYLRGMKTARPLTHDLFYSCLTVLGTSILRVLIYKAKEGVFYSYLYLKKEDEIIRIDSRTSDAIALAVRADCPIFVYESILESECIHPEPDAEDDDSEARIDSVENIPDEVMIKQLETRLSNAILDENYEEAARMRDLLRQFKK